MYNHLLLRNGRKGPGHRQSRLGNRFVEETAHLLGTGEVICRIVYRLRDDRFEVTRPVFG
jgi:hypothetical protein